MKPMKFKQRYGVVCIYSQPQHKHAVARLYYSLFGARTDLVFQSDDAEEALRQVNRLCECNNRPSGYKLVVNYTTA
jgi:hypothetical protein